MNRQRLITIVSVLLTLGLTFAGTSAFAQDGGDAGGNDTGSMTDAGDAGDTGGGGSGGCSVADGSTSPAPLAVMLAGLLMIRLRSQRDD